MCDAEEIYERAKKQRQLLIDAVKKEALERVLKRQAEIDTIVVKPELLGLPNDKEEIQKAIMKEERALWEHFESVWV